MRKPRTYHYLQTAPAGEMPERFAALGVCHYPVTADKSRTGKACLAMAQWAFGTFEMVAGDYLSVNVYTGSAVPALRVAMMESLRKGKQLDVWICNAMESLGAMDWFLEVQNGHWKVKDGDWNGYATTTDPPVMITVRPSMRFGVMRLLCLKNIGITGADELRESTNGCVYCRDNWQEKGVDWRDVAIAKMNATSRYIAGWYRTIKEEKLGSQKTTIAAQAWTAYRHRFLRSPVLCHGSQEALQLEESAIIQGRTECFRIGRIAGPVHHYDIKSCYPACAYGEYFPARMKRLVKCEPSDLLDEIANGWLAIAEVSLETDVACFPKVASVGTIFPKGRFRTTLCAKELIAALQSHSVAVVHKAALYEGERLFDQYGEWMLDFRKRAKDRGDRIGERICKLLTNSLWGRFAKQVRLWRNESTVSSHSPWDDWYERDNESGLMEHYRVFGNLGQHEVSEGFDHDACPAITAWIASLGRWKLWETLTAAQPGNVWYCATDSLFCDQFAVNQLRTAGLIRQNSPGYLSLKGVYEWMVIHGIHHYDTSAGSVSAGVPIVAVGAESTGFTWQSLEKTSSQLKRKHRPSASLVESKRGSCGPYKHGKVKLNGDTEPLFLSDWERF